MRWPYWVLVGVAIAIVVISSCLAWRDWPTTSSEWATSGQKGDYWGGHFSAAGSLAAAILFLVAVFLQRDELQAQREELQLTREEMQQARGVHEAQEKQLKRQAVSAERSAVVSEVMSLMQFRNQLRMHQYQNLDSKLVRDLENQLRETVPFLLGLLTSNSLSEQESAYLARAAGLHEKVAEMRGIQIKKIPEVR